MSLTLSALAAVLGVEQDAITIDTIKTMQASAADVGALRTSVEAANAQIADLGSERDALTAKATALEAQVGALTGMIEKMKAEAESAPAPAAVTAGKFKKGDKVMVGEMEEEVEEEMPAEVCYKMTSGKYAPESRCKEMSAAVVAQANAHFLGLSAVARLSGCGMSEQEIRAVALDAALGKLTAEDAYKRISERPAVPNEVINAMSPTNGEPVAVPSTREARSAAVVNEWSAKVNGAYSPVRQ